MAVIAWLFLAGPDGWSRLLFDGDTGWHIRTGEYILDHRTVPATDLFSFSKPDQPWFAWEWLADLIFAALFRVGGFKALVLFCGTLIALYVVIVFRWTLSLGANTLIALLFTFVAMGACSIHYLARPHLFTLVLFPLSLWILERGQALWILIPITVLWTNLHGGFLAFIASLALYAIGCRSVRLAGLTLACSLATLVNPYGYRLHLHVWSYLNSDWIREVIHEFQAPSFRGENQLQYELLLVAGLMVATLCLFRGRFSQALLLLFWAHQSLTSVRHVTLFATVATPILAVELTLLVQRISQSWPPRSTLNILNALAQDMGVQCRRMSTWPALTVVLLAIVPLRFPTDFPDFRFPVHLVTQQASQIVSGRVLTTDQWADYLLFRFHPTIKVFFDGRSDFYGPEIGRDYINVANGQHNWRSILDRYRFDLVLLPPEWSLASLLKQDRGWELVADDGKSLMFRRVHPNSGKAPSSTLMEFAVPAEYPPGDLASMNRSKPKAVTGTWSAISPIPSGHSTFSQTFRPRPLTDSLLQSIPNPIAPVRYSSPTLIRPAAVEAKP